MERLGWAVVAAEHLATILIILEVPMISTSILCVLFVIAFYCFLGFCASVLRLVELEKAEAALRAAHRAAMREPAPKRLPKRVFSQPKKDRNEYT